MFPQLALRSLLAIALSIAIGHATPVDTTQDLVVRDNKFGFKCGNAPGITAGELVNPSDYQLGTSLPETGSDQQWFKYLYCTVGTRTYTFFGLGQMDPAQGAPKLRYHNVYSAFNQAAATVLSQQKLKGGDGPVGLGWKFIQSNTNIVIDIQNAAGGKLTYGILSSALTGLANAALNYNPTNAPMLFQINDGQWGEIAIGYAGFLDTTGKCYYEITPQVSKLCEDVIRGSVIT